MGTEEIIAIILFLIMIIGAAIGFFDNSIKPEKDRHIKDNEPEYEPWKNAQQNRDESDFFDENSHIGREKLESDFWQENKLKKRRAYYRRKVLLTTSEKVYFNLIRQAVPNQFFVFPQVCLSAIIDKSGYGYQNELYRIVDFGVFDMQLIPVLLIEINDSTHQRKDRAERDRRVQELTQEAGIPLLTFRAEYKPDLKFIKKEISEYLSR